MTYDEFIQNIINTRGQWNIPKDVYKERHHIIPRCLGGSGQVYQKHYNIIWLYPHEHYEAHKLLHYEHPHSKELAYAWFRICTGKCGEFITAEEYEEARLAHIKAVSGENNPMYGRSLYDGKGDKELLRIHNIQSQKRLDFYAKHPDFNKGKNNPMFNHYYSKEDLDRMFNGKSNPFYGHKHSDETKAIIKEKLTKYLWFTDGVTEIKCKIEDKPDGFTEGRIKKVCYTNGEIDIRLYPNETVPDGFYKGAKPKGLWYNNGVIEIHCNSIEDVPKGFYKGRLKRKYKNGK